MWPFNKRRRKPRENPRDTLVRYAKAIDAHFDLKGASPDQLTSYGVVVSTVKNAVDAQAGASSPVVVKTRIGFALGMCEAYIDKYRVEVPPYQPN